MKDFDNTDHTAHRMVCVYMPQSLEAITRYIAALQGFEDVSPELAVFVLQEYIYEAFGSEPSERPATLMDLVHRAIIAYRVAELTCAEMRCACSDCTEAEQNQGQ